MRITRRSFMKYCAVAAGALGLSTSNMMKIEESFAKLNDGGPHVIWLPGQACTGCKTSIANSIYYTTIDDLLLNTIDLDYSETLAAAAGKKAVDAALAVIGKQHNTPSEPVVLLLEGAIPSTATGGDDNYCTVWSRHSGILAANSTIGGGTPTTKGEQIYDIGGASGITLQQGDVIKAGTELFGESGNATTIPVNSIFDNTDDMTALGGTGVTTGYSGDVLNTGVTLNVLPSTGPLAPTSSILYMYGGSSSPYPSGSVLAAGTTFVQGTTFHDSYDRDWLDDAYGPHSASNGASQPPAARIPNAGHTFIGATVVGPQLNWVPNIANGGMDLQVVASDGVTVDNLATVRMTYARALSGQMELLKGSTLPAGTFLQALTRVPGAADRSIIDNTGVSFGYTTTTTGTVSSALTWTGGEYVLNGDITIAPNAVTATSILRTSTAEHDKTMLNESRLFGTSAAAILCIGTCSSFGGIPAAQGNLTGAAGALYKGRQKPGNLNGALTEFAAKTVNIAGCPPHPDWMVGTIAYILATNLAIPAVEAYGRPIDYYGEYQCNAGPCEWRFNQGYNIDDPGSETLYVSPKPTQKATNWAIDSSRLYKFKWTNDSAGQRNVGCIGVLGCKGRKTKADCSMRRWNADGAAPNLGAGWCVGSGAGCHGCTEPAFPDKVGKFFNFA